MQDLVAIPLKVVGIFPSGQNNVMDQPNAMLRLWVNLNSPSSSFSASMLQNNFYTPPPPQNFPLSFTLCELSLAATEVSASREEKKYICQYISTAVMWTAAGYSFGFSEPHIFGCLKAGRQAGRRAEWSWCVDVWWEAGRGSCCSSPWEEGHSERMSGEGPFRRSLSQSEWGGIRILLGRCACCPAIMAEINGSAALDRRSTCLPCVVSSGVKLIW